MGNHVIDYRYDRIPMKRPGQHDDLNGSIVLLAADACQYITDQTLLVDGGISAGAIKATISRRRCTPRPFGARMMNHPDNPACLLTSLVGRFRELWTGTVLNPLLPKAHLTIWIIEEAGYLKPGDRMGNSHALSCSRLCKSVSQGSGAVQSSAGVWPP